MCERQLRITDIVPDAIPPPEVWDCMKTCRHADEITDCFPGTKRKRCLYGIMHAGTGGKDWYSKVIDNIWHTWCRFYEEADE